MVAVTRAGAAIACSLVVLAYAAFASGGDFRFHGTTVDRSLYADQAEGFRLGHLHLASEPDPRLLALRDPYEPAARGGIHYLWDASLFGGHYQLYFTPLPVLAFYLPFHAATGEYPSDALVALLCAAWLYCASAAALRRLLPRGERRFPFPLWLLFVGLGSVVPFLLCEVRVYEVAVLFAAALAMTWAWSFVRLRDAPSSARAGWSALWLALAVVSRPTYVVLVPIAFAAVAMGRERRNAIRCAAAMLAVFSAVALVAFAYNAARFGSPFEPGFRYQLTVASNLHRSLAQSFGEGARIGASFRHYLAWPPRFTTSFPFVTARLAEGRWAEPGTPEEVIGIAAILPLAIAAIPLAWRSRGGVTTTLARGGAATLFAGGWLVMAVLASGWYVVIRYETDFLPLLAVGSAAIADRAVAAFPRPRLAWVAVTALALWSIAVGLLIPFQSRDISSQLLPTAIQSHPER
jgi:hypothetical protein